MIDIHFEINGRRVQPHQIKDALERAVFDGIKKQITDKLRGVRDPETGAPPKIIFKGHSLDDLSLEMNGSESMIEEVKKRLGMN